MEASEREALERSAADARGYERYVRAIAEARYTIRRVQRIIDERARVAGLDPLQHQALLQIYASDGAMLTVSGLAERLDVPVEVASRLVKQLDAAGMLDRRRGREDRRVTELRVTAKGRRKVHRILEDVIPYVEEFASQLPHEARLQSLTVFAFYLGIDLDQGRLQSFVTSGSGSPLWPIRAPS